MTTDRLRESTEAREPVAHEFHDIVEFDGQTFLRTKVYGPDKETLIAYRLTWTNGVSAKRTRSKP